METAATTSPRWSRTGAATATRSSSSSAQLTAYPSRRTAASSSMSRSGSVMVARVRRSSGSASRARARASPMKARIALQAALACRGKRRPTIPMCMTGRGLSAASMFTPSLPTITTRLAVSPVAVVSRSRAGRATLCREVDCRAISPTAARRSDTR